VEHFSSVTLKGRLLALHTNIRLGRKSLLETNARAYLEFDEEKSVVTFTPGTNVIKPFTGVIYELDK
jgi:hypothetical protein